MFIINEHDTQYIIDFLSQINDRIVINWRAESPNGYINEYIRKEKYNCLPKLLAKNVDIKVIGPKPTDKKLPLIIWQPLLFPER